MTSLRDYMRGLHDAALMANSYTRLGELIEAYHGIPETVDTARPWLRVLGAHWSCCDNIAAYQDELWGIFTLLDRPVRDMMRPQERHALDHLPDTVQVWRGCGPDNMKGMSWTTSADVARAFPTYRRYKQAEPLLLHATVQRQDIIALKFDREESEIIAAPDDVTVHHVERL